MHIFKLSQSDFEDIEHITSGNRQVRFGNWDDLWGSGPFKDEDL